MRTFTKLGLTGLVAALLLSTAISTASARVLSTTNGNTNLRVTWSRLEFAASPVTIRCRVTLEGSFHRRSIAKVRGTLIGAITRANVDTVNCTGGRVIPRPTPWHLTYEAFEGVLPNITTVDFLLARFSFRIEATVFGVTVVCLYGTSTDNITMRAVVGAGRAISTLNPVGGKNTVHLLEGVAFCPSPITLIGAAPDGGVTLLNSTSRITITLI